jgi:hypothetical protein
MKSTTVCRGRTYLLAVKTSDSGLFRIFPSVGCRTGLTIAFASSGQASRSLCDDYSCPNSALLRLVRPDRTRGCARFSVGNSEAGCDITKLFLGCSFSILIFDLDLQFHQANSIVKIFRTHSTKHTVLGQAHPLAHQQDQVQELSRSR